MKNHKKYRVLFSARITSPLFIITDSNNTISQKKKQAITPDCRQQGNETP
ncbi:MAG: hypothetical protein COB33_004620 [Thiotrichaceae bacterium]|nr:hypothetical protein [Thiotrichaceae bacterium]